MFRKMLYVLLAIIMVFLICTSVLAIGSDDAYQEPERIMNIPDENILGTLEDQTGVLLPDPPDDFVLYSTSTGKVKMFSMTASGVTGLLTTKGVSGKSFTLSTIPSGWYVLMEGRITSSAGTGYTYRAKVGTCYYNYLSGEFVANAYKHFDSGVSSQAWFVRDPFYNEYAANNLGYDSTKTYYGFVKNIYGSGSSESGSLTFWVAQRS